MVNHNNEHAALNRLEVLVLCYQPPAIAATLYQHLSALKRYSKHNVRLLSMLGEIPREVELDRFDVIVIHWSLIACSNTYLNQEARNRIAACRALKAIFIQDEYRFVDRTVATLRDLGIDILFTCVPDEEIEKVYPAAKLPGVTKKNVLTGYVDESLLQIAPIPYAERKIDVGYRARKLSAWMGELAMEKWRISDRFAADAPRFGLSANLSYREEDRLYGDAWINFLRNCRGALGVESGVSVFDFDGSLQETVERAEEQPPHPTFEELRERYFKDKDGLIRLNQISPRCFEAAALHTLMILYEGEYSGRLIPWRHYVPLKKDHSNMEEVVAVLRDPARAQEIIDFAYNEVALAPQNSFKCAISDFDNVIEQRINSDHRRVGPAYDDESFFVVSRKISFTTRIHHLLVKCITISHRLVYGKLLKNVSEPTRQRFRRFFRMLRRLALRAIGRTGTNG